MRKVIQLKRERLTYVLAHILGKQLSDTESLVLEKIIKYSPSSSFNLDVHLSKQIREELNITQSSFNTSISRLQEKNCIKKEGRTITLHPLFNNLSETKEILIKLY